MSRSSQNGERVLISLVGAFVRAFYRDSYRRACECQLETAAAQGDVMKRVNHGGTTVGSIDGHRDVGGWSSFQEQRPCAGGVSGMSEARKPCEAAKGAER